MIDEDDCYYSVIDEDDCTETSDLSITAADNDQTLERHSVIPPASSNVQAEVIYQPATGDKGVTSMSCREEYEMTGSLIHPEQLNTVLNRVTVCDGTAPSVRFDGIGEEVKTTVSPVMNGESPTENHLRRRQVDIRECHTYVDKDMNSGVGHTFNCTDDVLNTRSLTEGLTNLRYEPDHPSSCESESDMVPKSANNMQVL